MSESDAGVRAVMSMDAARNLTENEQTEETGSGTRDTEPKREAVSEAHRADLATNDLPGLSVEDSVAALTEAFASTDETTRATEDASRANIVVPHGLDDLLEGANAGLALFDGRYQLVACNRLYMDLCGLTGNDALRGVTLMELIRLASRALGIEAEEIERQVDIAIDRLKPGSSYMITHRRLDGSVIEIKRSCLLNGSVVETVSETDGDQSVMSHHMAEVARTRLDQALNTMTDGFTIWDRDDRLVMYNRRYIELNPGVADIITPGITYRELKGRAVARGLHDRPGATRAEIVEELIAQHRDPKAPHEMQLADGRWILVSERKTPDGSVVGTRTDITQLKERELALKEAAREIGETSLHFNIALENMNQGLCMFDKNGTLIVTNRRYLEMYGFSSDVVKPGATLREIMMYSVSLGNYTPEEAERALAEREARSTLAERTTVKQRLKDGRVIAVMNEPMADGGTIATYQDITEAENAARELQAYTDKLEASNRELQDFAYVASHDLQEPLRKIEAFGDRLSRKYAAELPDQGRMYIERMQDAAGRMRTLINDLLSYSRVTTKGREFKPTDLNDVMRGVLSDLSIRIEEQNATVEVGELPTLMSDTTQMRQLLQNLLSNALKFKRPDVDPVITVRARETDEAITLTVADNGIGFDSRFKDQIFTIFQRLHGRQEYEGTGVGLATTRKIVERHNGTIDADGRPGEGATFTITIPKPDDQ